jgi:hypothetical protein
MIQGQILGIAWKMWQHRNTIQHNEGNTIHQYKTEALDKEIREEMMLLFDKLDVRYNHLLQGTLNEKLNKSIIQK